MGWTMEMQHWLTCFTVAVFLREAKSRDAWLIKIASFWLTLSRSWRIADSRLLVEFSIPVITMMMTLTVMYQDDLSEAD